MVFQSSLCLFGTHEVCNDKRCKCPHHKTEQCRKCGVLLTTDKLFSVLYDDPEYVVCEPCMNEEDYSNEV